ncbi:MAG: type II toxin-antitoxin system VapC family toxin [bacterium]|nr:type II toxin-antitoxin system VapC family toxin [bacterium]
MLLIDTHVLLWLLAGDARLHANACDLIQDELRRQRLFVSSASYWELARLVQLGRIDLGCDLRIWRARRSDAGIGEIPLDSETLILAEDLRREGAPNDLADRLIMAGTISRRGRLATADRQILAWDGTLERVDVRR